uniref:Uncharacterized protein n=1 Tax=Arundo donax TaxID=35708 RepID=A0A0A9S6Z4_ARUDO
MSSSAVLPRCPTRSIRRLLSSLMCCRLSLPCSDVHAHAPPRRCRSRAIAPGSLPELRDYRRCRLLPEPDEPGRLDLTQSKWCKAERYGFHWHPCGGDGGDGVALAERRLHSGAQLASSTRPSCL